jgi:hypothetical protein
MGDDSDSPRTQRTVLAVMTLGVALAIVVPGALALQSNQDASDVSECRSLYAWVVCFMLAICATALLLVFAMCTRYATQGPDLRNPAGARSDIDLEQALSSQNVPAALKNDTTFRCGLLTAGLLELVFFLWGCVVYAQGSCSGHGDLVLYFRFVFWLFIVILPPCISCGAVGHFFLGSSSSAPPGESFVAIDQADTERTNNAMEHAVPETERDENFAVRASQNPLRSPSAATSSRIETV